MRGSCPTMAVALILSALLLTAGAPAEAGGRAAGKVGLEGALLHADPAAGTLLVMATKSATGRILIHLAAGTEVKVDGRKRAPHHLGRVQAGDAVKAEGVWLAAGRLIASKLEITPNRASVREARGKIDLEGVILTVDWPASTVTMLAMKGAAGAIHVLVPQGAELKIDKVADEDASLGHLLEGDLVKVEGLWAGPAAAVALKLEAKASE